MAVGKQWECREDGESKMALSALRIGTNVATMENIESSEKWRMLKFVARMLCYKAFNAPV